MSPVAPLLHPHTCVLTRFLRRIRKERKVRPGFTPQEDVSRFRSTRQKAMEANKLPPGHIPGWVPPSSKPKPVVAGSSKPGAAPGSVPSEAKPTSKSAAKNAKRKAKKQAEKDKVIQENWEDSDEDEKSVKESKGEGNANAEVKSSDDDINREVVEDNAGDALARDMEKLDVQ